MLLNINILDSGGLMTFSNSSLSTRGLSDAVSNPNLLRRLKVRGEADNNMASLSSSSPSCPSQSSIGGGTTIGVSTSKTKMKSNAKQQNYTIHPILHRLQQNDTSLTSLLILENSKPTKKYTIYYRPRNIQDWELLGQAIATNTNLIRLDIKLAHSAYLPPSLRHTPQTFNAFYAQLNKNRSIRRLSFNNVDIQDGRLFSELLQFFQSNVKLTSLSVTHQSIGIWSDQLSSILTTKPTSLKYLDLSYIEMTDDSCRILCTALESHHLGLRSLELNGNRLKHGGCTAIATLLVNPNCVLNRLCLKNNRIGLGAIALSDGLLNNKHLKTLLLDGNTAIASSGMHSLMKTVCNFPNVTDIINSNHTLQTLTLPTRVRATTLHQNVELEKKSKLSMQYSLRFNRGSSNQISSSSSSVNSNRNKVSYIINQKVVLHHFIFNTNIQLYEQLPGHLLPRLLSSIANYEVYNTKRSDEFASKDELFTKKDYNRRHVALHRFIRLCPSICERWVGSGGGSSNVKLQVEGSGEVDSSIKRMRFS